MLSIRRAPSWMQAAPRRVVPARAGLISRRAAPVSSDGDKGDGVPLAILRGMKGFLFVFRKCAAWLLVLGFGLAMINTITRHRLPDWMFVLAVFGTLGFVAVSAISHVHRVRLVVGRVDGEALGNRHRRQIMLPFPGEEAFTLVDTAIRELPHVDEVESARDSLQVLARVWSMNPYVGIAHAGVTKIRKRAKEGDVESAHKRNLVRATVSPGERTCSVTLVCEPQAPAWTDWFLVDDATNLENAEAVTRAITRRVGERRKGEMADMRATAT